MDNRKLKFRTEHDMLGAKEIPAEVLYGVHTQRASENFLITGVKLNHFPDLIRSLAMVKMAAAMTNNDLGVLDPESAIAITRACQLIIDGEHHEHFIVDMIQGGAGTSSNMNANEVIANLALIILDRQPGDYAFLHPNDHVNLSQSTNDVYPTAIRLAVLCKHQSLILELRRLIGAFRQKAKEFGRIAKVGRTQLQDAVPITLGSEFESFAATIEADIERLEELSDSLKVINLGGTAVGTCVNTPTGYVPKVVTALSEVSGIHLIGADNLIDASSDMGAFVSFSGLLRRVAVKISKICNDLRLLSSGPRAGIGEIILPAVQAGSSIMPGKVNPVIPEVVNQVAYEVVGNDMTITMAAEAGQLQLNAMEPVIAYNLLDSIRILTNAMKTLTDRCVLGIQADEERCADLLNRSLILSTALVPMIGYERAAEIAKIALQDGKPISEVVISQNIMTVTEFREAVSMKSMLG